jgi:CO/xanthine dehydrogenase Mo-binding subunit
MLNKEFSRKAFVKGGGALIVGFSVLGAAVGGKTTKAAYIDPFATVRTDLSQVDTYIAVHANNTVSLKSGASEFGQGTGTGLLMIAAEELDMDMSQMKFVMPDTGVTAEPQIFTHSSQATKNIGPQVRAAAAYARQELVRLASVSLGVPAASLTAKSGVVSGGGKSVTYGDLIGDKLFKVTMPTVPITQEYAGPNQKGVVPPLSSLRMGGASGGVIGPYLYPGEAPAKPVSQYKLVGTHVPRFDIPEIVTGTKTYVHNIRLPGMLHGRVVLPRGQAAYGSGAKPLSVDESSIKQLPGVRVVRRGDFVGVVAEKEYDAIQAAAQLKVTWADVPATLGGSGNFWSKLRADDAAGRAPARDSGIGKHYGAVPGPVGNVDAALKSAATPVSASYSYAYQLHGPIGPSCCVADVRPEGARLFIYKQGVSGTPEELAPILGLPASRIRVTEYGGSSHMGGSGDIAPWLAAAVMSQIVGKPVRVQYMRWDQHGWDIFGLPHVADLRGGIDANGKIVAWEFTTLAPGAGSGTILKEQLTAPSYPKGTQAQTDETAAGVQYELPNWRLVYKSAEVVGNYFPHTHMRASQSTQTTFAAEVFADELAYAAKMDPIAFRRLNVRKTQLPAGDFDKKPYSFNARFLAVLDALEKASKWQPRVAASNLSKDTVVTGRGISYGPRAWKATFSGVVADIEVNKKTGKILVKHLYAAQDSGLSINPAGMENQIVGQVVMNTSRALVEAVQFNNKRVTGLDWVSYPILRMKDAPKVTPIIITYPDLQPAGAGDHVMEHVPAAIANAFFDATGVRIRQVPMTPAVVRATLQAAGVK